MDGIVHDHAVTSKVLLQCRLSTACCKLEHLLLLAVLGNNSDRHRVADKDAGPPVHQHGGLRHAKADAECQEDNQST